jgi:hypothetical protein
MGKLEDRVVRSAERALAQDHVVSPIDVLVGIGWLPPSSVDLWRQGRLADLGSAIQVDGHRIATAIAILRRWAGEQGLQPSVIDYVARTRDRRALRFTSDGNRDLEIAFRTHWVAPELSDARKQRLAEKQSRPPDLVVIAALKDWRCTMCSGTGDLLIMEEPGPVCMVCANLDHLVFLPAGDAALTRRAKRASRLSAVVVRFSRSRKRYERQGILVEEEALTAAEAQ